MHKVTVSDPVWRDLLALREGRTVRHRETPAFSLFRPIAQRAGRFVMAQVGQSLDGRIATPAGDAKNISGADGIRHLHRCRALVDAVIVGVGTVISDNPQLSVRAVSGPSPVRVVIDCNGTMPPRSQMLSDGGTQVLVVTADDVKKTTGDPIRLPRGPRGLCPSAILDALAARGLTTVLVEGGARTIARFVNADLVDRLHVTVAPLIIGSGPAGISLSPVQRLSQAHRPEMEVYDIGSDILFDCRVKHRLSASARPVQGQHIEVPNHA